jgi:anti-sigma regulatory factor (Ser/Thr protein kinase)
MKRGPLNEIPEEITVSARADSVAALIEFVSTHAWECGFQDEAINKINLAVKEALDNILYFACSNGEGEIRIVCSIHNSGALQINIADTGKPFNVLLSGTFPEADDFTEPGRKPSTKVMKKVIKNVEYRREIDRNVLIFIVSKDLL